MNTKLLNCVPKELREEFKVRFKEEHLVLEYIVLMLERDLQRSLEASAGKAALDSPNYLAHQAWRNGEQDTLRQLISILKDKS
mgnify:CR=1 FL=1